MMMFIHFPFIVIPGLTRDNTPPSLVVPDQVRDDEIKGMR